MSDSKWNALCSLADSVSNVGDIARYAISEIESLQRENDQLVEIKSMYESAMATDRQRIKELRAAAITPEMRERIKGYIDIHSPVSVPSAEHAKDIFRDLLGEQG